MFIDEVSVKLRAGDGGDGSASFRREKYIPKGGPDGGDGGNGGDLILECDGNVGDLRTYYFKPHWEAKNGQTGSGQGKKGRSGADCILKVPAGTVVFNKATGEKVAELLRLDERIVLLNGGNGGWGNIHFKSSVNQRPSQYKEGLPGERGEFRFILKTIADIGIVGYPNAGKSTLISSLTAAQPKTGAYPFTTINPVVGIMESEDTYSRITLADIPGLVEGAHENKGLGHTFLRHIERCRGLLILVDMSETEGRDPFEDYEHLLAELEQYGNGLIDKQMLVVGSKLDEPGANERFKVFQKQIKKPTLGISTLAPETLKKLRAALFELASKSVEEENNHM